MQIVRGIARPLLASSFIVSGVNQVRQADQTAESLSLVVKPVAQALPNVSEKNVARGLGAAQILAGALLALGKLPRLAGFVLTLTSGLKTVAEFSAADTSTPSARAHQRSQLLKNISLTGGVLLASVDTAGRPGLAWRAEHLAQSSTRAGRKQLERTAKQVQKQAKKAGNTVTDALNID